MDWKRGLGSQTAFELLRQERIVLSTIQYLRDGRSSSYRIARPYYQATVAARLRHQPTTLLPETIYQ